MVAVLIYQTTNGAFADRAIEELLKAGIPCYRWGPATSGDGSYRARTGAIASIYIERDADFRAANEILIKLGAVQDKPSKIPEGLVLRIALLISLVVVVGYLLLLIISPSSN
jgi:hypothetical protein